METALEVELSGGQDLRLEPGLRMTQRGDAKEAHMGRNKHTGTRPNASVEPPRHSLADSSGRLAL
jgi:hypothetical protein